MAILCMNKMWRLKFFGVCYLLSIVTLLMRNNTIFNKDTISRYSQNHTMCFEVTKGTNNSFLQMSIQDVYQKSLRFNKHYFKSTSCSRLFSKSKTEEIIRDKLLQLGEDVQHRIATLQNVKDCTTARKLVLYPCKDGYGSTVHMVMTALMLAFGTNRTLIFNSQNWRYSRNGWEQYHMPLSSTCTNVSGKSHTKWDATADPVKLNNIDVLYLPRNGHFRGVKVKPLLTLSAIPIDIAKQLICLHKKPLLWWSAQFVKYVLQYQPWVKDEVTKYIPFSSPSTASVGLHIRRTDKVKREADFFPIDLYMKPAKHFLHQLPDNKVVINLATDDITVQKEIQQSFSEYTFQSIDYMNKLQNINNRRYSDEALLGMILDLHLLLSSDYIVCTLSSNVCQLLYELLQIKHGDATKCLYSLDSGYFFSPRFEPYKVAIKSHIYSKEAKTSITNMSHSQYLPELNLITGDIIQIPRRGRRIKEGFSYGTNQRTGQQGSYPNYKVVDLVQIR